MNNKKITIIFIMIAVSSLLGIVGLTVAYFTSSTDFENEFQTGLFQTEATETFTSPSNWLPGDTTPKDLTIKNTGNVDVKARVCITESWESDNGDTLPNYQNGNRVAILNLANTSDWNKIGNCYEYNDTLEPNNETSSFISGVTFNPNIEADIECTTSGNTKTCTSSGDGYDNATYTLTFTVETVQANKAREIWNPIRYVDRQYPNEVNSGDEVCINSECFYVVSSYSDKTVLLSKYNLLVGNIVDYSRRSGVYTLNKILDNTDEGYGLQNSSAKGYYYTENNFSSSEDVIISYVGEVPFSGTNYWSGGGYTDNEVYDSSKNSVAPSIDYSDYFPAQNNGYTISYFVENYVNALKELGAPSTISGRLLSYDEAISLGCNDYTWGCSPIDIWNPNDPTDGEAPSWVYSTSYWLSTSTGSSDEILVIFSDGWLESIMYNESRDVGVRPVIEIPTSELLPPNRYVYSNVGLDVDGTIPSGIVTYGSSDRILENNDYFPFYLKYKLEDNELVESYVELVVSDELAVESGLNEGIYSLRGGGATYNESTSSYNNDSIYYNSNKSELIKAFGSENCEESNNEFTCILPFNNNNGLEEGRTYKSGFVSIYQQGSLGEGKNGWYCLVYQDGRPICSND